MSYYGNDLETAESSFDDPTAELEAGAQADDPEGDLGDGLRRKGLAELEGADLDHIRARRIAKGM
jgi:hypothetical protein